MKNKRDKKYSWQCPECGLIVKSDYEGQFDINKKRHIQKHKRKEVGK